MLLIEVKKVSQGRPLKFHMSRGNAEDLIEASVVNQVACLFCQRINLFILKGGIREP